MADLTRVEDEAVRTRLQEANAQLRKGKATDAVHTLADLFVDMLSPKDGRRPDEGIMVPGGRGQQAPLAMRWPNLGANLTAESLQEGRPEIEFVRDRFAMSEAFTYYEFTVEVALTLQEHGR